VSWIFTSTIRTGIANRMPAGTFGGGGSWGTTKNFEIFERSYNVNFLPVQ
jgi:hypothetical protein